MHSLPRMRSVRGVVAFMVVLAMLASALGLPEAGGTPSQVRAQDEPLPTGDVIVILDPGSADSAAEVVETAAEEGVEAEAVFTTAVDGFSATVTEAEAAALAGNPDVAAIFPDNPVYQADQQVPAGISRVGADTNDVANINGFDQRVNADVAVLDSGIDPNTGDLNIAGGTDCADAGTITDGTGHGTHVAGTLAALDNNIGVVGVAPGARLWSVRVLNNNGVGSDSTLICGLDWVFANRTTIDVVNMSVVGSGADLPCTRSSNPANWQSPLHEMVCKLYDAGIPIVAAAGNQNKDASSVTPATFDEVIAVSAFADFNGQPGGGAPKPSGCGQLTADDHFFTAGAGSGSNWGADVDILAPGVCVRSTAMGGGISTRTGTSMSAPHVAGAVALFKSQNSAAGVDAVKDWLFSLAQPQSGDFGILGGDPDGIAEPVLRIGLGDIPLATITPTPSGTITPPLNAYKLVKSSASSGASNRARDNTLGTLWVTRSNTPATAWIWVQLPSSLPVGSIRWYFGELNIADRYWIETSDDLVNWRRIAKRGNGKAGIWSEVRVTGVTAKYVRFRFENPYGDVKLGGIAEIQVWAPGAPPANPTATPLPPVKYPIASTSQTLNSKNGIKTLDSDAGTYWITNQASTPPSSAIVQLSLGTQKLVGAVRWMFGVEGIADLVRIEVSSNGSTWTQVATRTNAPLYEWQELPVGLQATYVRFRVENPNRDSYLGGIAEIEVWSGAGGPLTSVAVPATPTASSTPSSTPSSAATSGPFSTPSETPTPLETPVPTETPTETSIPTETATDAPTETPTDVPTETPTDVPTEAPTQTPTETPMVGQGSIEQSEGAVVAADAAGEESQPYRPRRVRGTGNASGVANLFDGDPATHWSSDLTHPPEEISVIIDLGESKWVSSIDWLFALPGMADLYRIEVSTNRADWYLVFEGGSPAAGVWLAMPVGTEARFIKVTVENPNLLPQIGGLGEVEIWP